MRVETIGDATLYLGDCREIMPSLPKVDAVLADPPYGINYSPGGGGRGAFGRPVYKRFTGADVVMGDDTPFDPLPFLGWPCILWGANHYAPRLPAVASWLIWDKREAESNLSFADCEMAWTNLGGQARIFRHMWNGVAKASECGQSRVHPTQKPVALMRWCLNQLPVGVVLDPYLGSGSSGVACAQLGRKFIGVEICEKYYDIACERIDNAYRQQRLEFA